MKEIKKTKWYQDKPEIIKKAINLRPPNRIYKFRSSGKQCILVSYEEPLSGKFEDITLTVEKIGKGGVLSDIGLGSIDTNQVFGVKISDIIDIQKAL